METPKFIWMDGRLVPGEEAKVGFLTHALHYGSGAFEGIRFYNTITGPAIFRLPEHLNRLFNSIEVFRVTVPYSRRELTKAIIETIKANELEEGYIRPLVYFGDKVGLDPIGAPVKCGIAVWRWEKYLGKASIEAIVSKNFIRLHPKSAVMAAKISGYYFNSIMASLEARWANADETILLDYRGYVAEGSAENIFIVDERKRVVTPPLGAILPGITRDTMINLLKILSSYLIFEEEITIERLKSAKEVFLTGTAAEIIPVCKIDDRIIGNGISGPVTRYAKMMYEKIVHGQCSAFGSWLTYVDNKWLF